MTSTLTMGMFAPARRRSDVPVAELGDLLLNTIVGIVLTIIVAGIGAPFLIHALASGKTSGAEQIEGNISIAAVQYFQDNQVYPSNLAALVPKYLPTTPVDPVDSANGTGDFTLTAANDANGNASYIVVGTVKHDPTTLNALKQAGSTTVPGTAPTVGGCASGACSVLIYDPAYGQLGD